ncbi:MAG: TetR/AcrR family transcriptional regulator [Solirubrobacteraceae bacterium]
MTAAPSAPPGRRARHDALESEREILAAAEQLLRERPFREITVADIMSRTGLKRPAFYVHFKDRYDLVLRVVEQIGTELYEMADRWLQGSAPREDIRVAMDGVARVYAAHGPVMRALADAATSDARVEASYRALVQGFVDATAEHIHAEQRAGEIAAELDAAETARALVWLNERYLYETLGAGGHEDPGRAASVLRHIWLATLYP